MRLASIALLASLVVGCSPALDRPASAPDRLWVSEPTRGDEAPPAEEQLWVGGQREVVVDAPPSVVMAVLFDADAYWSILPSVKRVEVVARPSGDELVVRVTQGVAFLTGSYTAHVLRESDERVKIWVDRSLPRDIDSAEGFAELTALPGGRTRVSYQMRADLGKNRLARMVSAKIERVMLRPPELLQHYIEGLPPSARRR